MVCGVRCGGVALTPTDAFRSEVRVGPLCSRLPSRRRFLFLVYIGQGTEIFATKRALDGGFPGRPCMLCPIVHALHVDVPATTKPAVGQRFILCEQLFLADRAHVVLVNVSRLYFGGRWPSSCFCFDLFHRRDLACCWNRTPPSVCRHQHAQHGSIACTARR